MGSGELPGDQFFTICQKLYKSMTGYSQAPFFPVLLLQPGFRHVQPYCHCEKKERQIVPGGTRALQTRSSCNEV